MITKVICGEYLHFKGKPYIVYGTAIDKDGTEYVLYQHDYGTKEFWIRPVDMFYEIIDRDGVTLPRFKLTAESSTDESFEKLINTMSNTTLKLNHSETLEVYVITEFDRSTHRVYIDKNS